MAVIRRCTKDGVDHIVVNAPPDDTVEAKKGDYAFDQSAGCLYHRLLGGWQKIGPCDAPLHDETPAVEESSDTSPLPEDIGEVAQDEPEEKPKKRRRLLGG